jgi:hypothetical protein
MGGDNENIDIDIDLESEIESNSKKRKRTKKKENIYNNIENSGILEGICAPHLEKSDYCIKELITEIKEKIDPNIITQEELKDDKKVIPILTEKLKCDNEKCVAKKLHTITTDVPKTFFEGIELLYKVEGPKNNLKWLSNLDIDRVLDSYELKYPFFYHIYFMMDDFENSPEDHIIHELVEESNNKLCDIILSKNERIFQNKENKENNENIHMNINININESIKNTTIKINNLLEKVKNNEKTCLGMVLNTDKWSGRGIHWTALFIDLREKKKVTIEFFNSSANKPSNNIKKLMLLFEEKISKCEGYKDKIIERINVVKTEMQKGDSECGLYSIYYIHQRLRGIPIEYFENKEFERISDETMTKYRNRIFNDD